jgi:hypothetical protein
MLIALRLASVALPLVIVQSGGTKKVPMKDVAIYGSAVGPSRQVKIVLEAGIGTIFGRIPIRGNTVITYDCQSAFTGKVSYSGWVRFFAKLKRVDLLTDMDGTLAIQDRPACPALSVDSIVGQASADTAQFYGWLKMDRDSLSFRGPAWMMGDSSYHATLTAVHRGRQLELRVNMYER